MLNNNISAKLRFFTLMVFKHAADRRTDRHYKIIIIPFLPFWVQVTKNGYLIFINSIAQLEE